MNYLFIAFERLKPGLGTGHIVRVKKIIEALCSYGSFVESITFISNITEQSQGYSLVSVHDLDEASQAIKSCIVDRNIDVVIFDCLDYCRDTYIECAQESIITIGIDTSSRHSAELDILVNPVIENQASHLAGSFYSIHSAGLSYQNKRVNLDGRKSIFICFGGLDYQGHFAGITPFISSLPSSYEINIILASEDDFHCMPLLGDNVNLLYRPLNFYDLLERAHIAIISGGILLQECLHMGVPAYVIPQYDHQFKIAKEKNISGLLVGVGNLQPNYDDTINSVLSVVEDSDHLDRLALRSRASDDGYGLSRISKILGVLNYLPWDSMFFGKEIYILNTEVYTSSIKNKIDVLVAEKSIDLIYFLCPSSDSRSLDFALRDGFKCVDDKLTFLITKLEFNSAISDGQYDIIKSSPSDITGLKLLSVQSKWTTRYYNDDKFPRDLVQTFYSEWVRKSVTGDLDDMVFHIEEDGVIIGFVTIKKNGRNFGSIGLIAVAEKAQGRGLGARLATYAVNFLLNEMDCAAVEVVTQQNNLSARKTYERIGFRVFNKSTWLHKWI